MGSLSLTVKVLDLSPKVTLADLNIFFSYCGTVETIWLQSYKDNLHMAYVTFRQPYAYQTALLLNGVTIRDRAISILRLKNSEVPIFMDALNPPDQVNVVEMLNMLKDKLGEIYNTLEKGAEMQHHKGSANISTDYVSDGAFWLSRVLDKASKHVSHIANKGKNN